MSGSENMVFGLEPLDCSALLPTVGVGLVGIPDADTPDVCAALAELPLCEKVTVLPRLIRHAPETLPPRIELVEKAANSRVRYVCELARMLIKRERHDVVLCGHINLLPLAELASRLMSDGLASFSYEKFRERLQNIIGDLRVESVSPA
jgi:hypothetical protein